MLYIWLSTQKPQHNLAVEEYLFKNFDEEIFMLWQNSASIIIGKHQNALSEININYVNKNGIIVVRRNTGGGAVFHDLGNLNFSFIKNVTDKEKSLDFQKYTAPILQALRRLGIDAQFEGRNDLTIEGKKISGNAMAFYKNRVLSHGTLLFSTMMNDLSNALNVDPEKFSDKAVKSVQKRVVNISDYLKIPMSALDFKDKIMESVMDIFENHAFYEFTSHDLKAINKLEYDKYHTWDWNYGRSPRYNFSKKIRTAGGSIELIINVVDGVIDEVRFFGDYFSHRDSDELERHLMGINHEKNAIETVLKEQNFSEYFNNATLEELVGLFF